MDCDNCRKAEICTGMPCLCLDGAKKIARFVIITIVIVACLLAVFTLAINHKANQNYQQVKK